MAKLSHRIAIGYFRTKLKFLSLLSPKKAAEMTVELFSTPQLRHKEPLTKLFEESEKLHFLQDGNKITGYRWNQGGYKKILITHGFNSSVVKFEHFIMPLIGKGYEVLAFDALAHGHSSGKTLNAIEFKDMIKTIYDKYGPVHSYMGHSFGGLAICLALEEIDHTANTKLVLIAPATESTTAMKYFFGLLNVNRSVQKEFKQQVEKISQKPIEWFSVSRSVENLKAKIFWCHDESDSITPISDVKNVMDKQYPNIDFFITKGLGHRRIYHDNKVVKAIIDFI